MIPEEHIIEEEVTQPAAKPTKTSPSATSPSLPQEPAPAPDPALSPSSPPAITKAYVRDYFEKKLEEISKQFFGEEASFYITKTLVNINVRSVDWPKKMAQQGGPGCIEYFMQNGHGEKLGDDQLPYKYKFGFGYYKPPKDLKEKSKMLLTEINKISKGRHFEINCESEESFITSADVLFDAFKSFIAATKTDADNLVSYINELFEAPGRQ